MRLQELEIEHCRLGRAAEPVQAVEAMASHCERCSGLLYWTELREWDGSRGQDQSGALQCIICGNIIDPVIVRNRQRGRAAFQEVPRSQGRRWRRTLSGSGVSFTEQG